MGSLRIRWRTRLTIGLMAAVAMLVIGSPGISHAGVDQEVRDSQQLIRQIEQVEALLSDGSVDVGQFSEATELILSTLKAVQEQEGKALNRQMAGGAFSSHSVENAQEFCSTPTLGRGEVCVFQNEHGFIVGVSFCDGWIGCHSNPPGAYVAVGICESASGPVPCWEVYIPTP